MRQTPKRNFLLEAKMKAKARLKQMAGADTTSAGEPDYAKMFLSMMHRLGSTKKVSPDSAGAKREFKGIYSGD